MVGAVVICISERPMMEELTVYYRNSIMIRLMK